MMVEKQGVGNMPAGVAFVGVLTLLNAVATMVLGGLLLWASGDAEVLGEVDLTADDAQIFGWSALVVGAITLLVGIGLFRGSRFARFLVITLMVIRIGLDVFALLAIDGYPWIQGAISIAWAALIIIMLTTSRASAFFHQR
ncbi:hypothetical protein [Demequina sp. NBRC 110053]|uniref:DUF7144 family membrane protein n=1 Tax=Demequina sp. NBRC 110053 TaxID=1570342 RepID=UPI000A03ED1D|nr:hypothetical protein [Demequina sp. NBRC 110053]